MYLSLSMDRATPKGETQGEHPRGPFEGDRMMMAIYTYIYIYIKPPPRGRLGGSTPEAPLKPTE